MNRSHNAIQMFKALLHNPFDRLAGLHLVLKPEQHGAVFLQLVAVEIQCWNHFGKIIHEYLKIKLGRHSPFLIEIGVN